MPAMRKLFSLAATAAATLALCTAALAEPMVGEEIYQKCVNCHGGDAHGKQFKGDKRAWAPAIAGLDKEYLARQLGTSVTMSADLTLRMCPVIACGPWHECSTMK